MKNLTLNLVLASILFLSSCSGLKVTSETNSQADFSKYKTYEIVHYFNQAALEQREIYMTREVIDLLNKSVMNEANKKGMKMGTAPEAILIWSFGFDLETSYAMNNYYIGDAYRTYPPTYFGYTNPTLQHAPKYDEIKGKLSVALVDRKTKKLLWLGEGRKKMNIKKERDDDAIRAVVARIMSSFPQVGE